MAIQKARSSVQAIAASLKMLPGWLKALIFFVFALTAFGADFAGAKSLLIAAGAPIEMWPARTTETLIIVSEFHGTGDYDPATRILNSLHSTLEQSDTRAVRIERSSIPPSSTAEAIELGQRYKASVVIWGTYDNAAISPGFEVLNQPELKLALPPLEPKTNTHPPSFHVYIAQSLPLQYDYFVLVALGQIYLLDERFGAAIEVLSKALSINLGNEGSFERETVYALRGFGNWQIGNLDMAIADFESSLRVDPNKIDTLTNMATLQAIMDDYESSLKTISRAIKTDPSFWLAHDVKGLIHYYLRQHDEALQEFDRAEEFLTQEKRVSEQDRSSILASIYNHRGLVYSATKQNESARKAYLRAIELEPSNPVNYHNLGDVELNVSNYEAALKYLELSIQHGSDDYKTYQLRGVAQRNLRDYEAARRNFEYVIQKAPDYGGGYYERGLLNRLEGNWYGALQDLSKTISIWPDNIMAFEERALVLVYLRRYGEALEDYETLVKLDPESAGRYVDRGMMYLLLGKPLYLAFADFDKAVALQPLNWEAYIGRGAVNLWLGKTQAALSDCEYGAARLPNNSLGAQCVGIARVESGQYQKAIEPLTAAIAADGSDLRALLARANAYAHLGQFEAANKDCQQAMLVAKATNASWLGSCVIIDSQRQMVFPNGQMLPVAPTPQ